VGSTFSSCFGNLEYHETSKQGRIWVLLRTGPIKSVTTLYEGKSVLKLEIFEKIPEPEWESFVASRQDWEKPLKGAMEYKTRSLGDKIE
jgi:hypothetical protein